MAITSEIIGRLGGADVDVIPVEGVASGDRGSSEVLATIDIPAGETWLVAVIGQMTAASAVSTNQPGLYLGDVSIPRTGSNGTYRFATTETESISFSIRRNYSSGTDSFTGHVYAVKL